MSNDRIELAKSSQALEVVAEAAVSLPEKTKGQWTFKVVMLVLLMVINVGQVVLTIPSVTSQPIVGCCQLNQCLNQTTLILQKVSALAAALTASSTSVCNSSLSSVVFS